MSRETKHDKYRRSKDSYISNVYKCNKTQITK